MSLFEVSKHIVGLYSTIVFCMSMSSLSVNLGILGFEDIVPEVVAFLVISLK
jgi:hypothetical protein